MKILKILSLVSMFFATLAFAAESTAVKHEESKAAEVKAQPQSIGLEGQALAFIHLTNQVEIQAGKLAHKRASAKDIQKFGQMLVTDHSQADKQVLNLARRLKISLRKAEAALPNIQAIRKEHATMLRTLRSLTTKDFDTEFVKDMVHGHEAAIKALTKDRDALPAGEVHKLIEALLPKLQEHLKVAKDLEAARLQA